MSNPSFRATPVAPSGAQTPFDPRDNAFLRADRTDAKFLSQSFQFLAGDPVDKVFTVYGCGIYFDNGPGNTGVLQLQFDTCFPFMNVRQGLFMSLGDRIFKQVIIRNISGLPTGVFSFCYSDNPNWIVIAGRS